jgi:predicted membrane protein
VFTRHWYRKIFHFSISNHLHARPLRIRHQSFTVGSEEQFFMKSKHLYLLLCLIGTILPYLFLAPFLREHGLDLRLIGEQLFANQISSFFGMDVIVTTVCLWIFVYFEGRKLRVKHLWAPVLASLTVGVSLGLPLFLLLRESRTGQDQR